jgi:hypothetical protein
MIPSYRDPLKGREIEHLIMEVWGIGLHMHVQGATQLAGSIPCERLAVLIVKFLLEQEPQLLAVISLFSFFKAVMNLLQSLNTKETRPGVVSRRIIAHS